MKAKEYFDKYFNDVDITSVDAFTKAGVDMLGELMVEAKDIAEKRHCKTNDAVDGVIREQNAKWNSIANMVEKKYGRPLLKRNGVQSYWQHYTDTM